jgi:CSLREA domain-containing protein
VAALAALSCALISAPAASAELFNVDHTGDQVDSNPGNGVCETASEGCTLRAAIEEANSSAGFDEIIFEEEVFEGQAAATIALGKSLPPIVHPVAINGKECPTAAGVKGPCAGIDGPSGGPALTVDHTAGVEIFGLAVTGAQTGIEVEGSPNFKAQADWVGVKLDGSAGPNKTGILLGPESDNGRIGGEGPEARNVIAGNEGDGLEIHGASGTKVLGNYFGVTGDGASRLANGKDIEVTSLPGGGPEASGTAIGTRVSAQAAATPKCDGGCNLISGSGSSGIDLGGDGGEEAPAVATTVLGNFIGLDAGGTAPIPNTSSGIFVGQAAQAVIGGPKVGEANRINGGATAVLAGPAAPDLVVRGNLVGLDAAGTAVLAPPGEGIAVDSEGLSSLAVEAIVAGNEIGMAGGVAIDQEGLGATISGNQIRGAETGIQTHGLTAGHGNLIEGNSAEDLAGSGILVENDLNEVFGNEVSGAGGAGIWIKGSLPPGATQNLVGGDTAAEENVIVGSGGDAIEITDLEATENEVARNRGIANNGLFIDLVATSPGTEPKGPNKGIEPPVFVSATEASAGGGGAEAGADVRVFRKQLAATGELQSFLGEATADAGGHWEVVYGGAIPAGTIVAATQTSATGGTSELRTATTAAQTGGGPGGGSGGTGKGLGHPSGEIPPRTKIVKAPKSRSRSGTVRFEFESDELDSTFQCRLDGKPFRPCRSPKRYEGLKPGRHLFEVRAIDPSGNVDPSPAKRRFKVLGGRTGRRR